MKTVRIFHKASSQISQQPVNALHSLARKIPNPGKKSGLVMGLALSTMLATTVSVAEDNKPRVIAKVNDTEITTADINIYMQSQASGHRRANPNDIIAEMVSRELLRQEAEKQGLQKSETFQKELEIQKTNLLVNALLQQKLESADLSDEQLKKEYDAQLKDAELDEYKARHILVEKEDEAKAVIKELEGGADFQQLAKDKSTGPSGPNGGDLGWFSASTMVPEFGNALKTMKKGDSSSAPVKTNFGWHVILLEDKRTKEPPKYEDSKAQLKSIVANRQVQAFIKALRDQANIEFTKPEEK